MTGVAKNTIQKLTRGLGKAVLEYHDNVLRNVKARRVQCDEIWCFCYAKDKNLSDDMRGQPGVGSMWTWTAIDADTGLEKGLAKKGRSSFSHRLEYSLRPRGRPRKA